jgi:parvulin-like peptidyl-prolyl isomerase
MPDLQTVIATAGGVSLLLGDLLRSLHRRGRLRSLALEALAEQITLHAAAEAGLSVSDAELQKAADRFRYRHGLTAAEQTQQWLTREGLTIEDFEAGLERDLLLDKFKRHVTEPLLAGHFAAHRDRYARARLRQIVVGSEGLTRELVSQLTDEGQDFAELAGRHSLHGPSRLAGGSVGVVARHALPPAVAEAIFAARAGAVVGPIPGPDGFALFLVEALLPPELDEETTVIVRQELFDAWLRERLADVRMDWSWLSAVDRR